MGQAYNNTNPFEYLTNQSPKPARFFLVGIRDHELLDVYVVALNLQYDHLYSCVSPIIKATKINEVDFLFHGKHVK